MSFKATVLADSISNGVRLTTYLLRYPRFIHAEFMTHRDLARNASSSRAIPTQKLIEDMIADPAMPVFWGSNQPGMQAAAELDGDLLAFAKDTWLEGMHKAIGIAQALNTLGLHKQHANRGLETYGHINVVASATRWNNFFSLRRHSDAQPEFKVLADLMFEEMDRSIPKHLQYDDWHLPFIVDEDWATAKAFLKVGRIIRSEPSYLEMVDVLKKVSAARCARTSYRTHDGRVTTVEEDVNLWNRLVGSQPLHASPTEHQATPDLQMDSDKHEGAWEWERPDLHGNLHGWKQLRKMLPGEYVAS